MGLDGTGYVLGPSIFFKLCIKISYLMGRVGRVGWNIKSVLHFYSYFVGILLRYIPTCICNKKLSPTFLWVSKFDVKLECLDFIFKTFMGKCVFEKSC